VGYRVRHRRKRDQGERTDRAESRHDAAAIANIIARGRRQDTWYRVAKIGDRQTRTGYCFLLLTSGRLIVRTQIASAAANERKSWFKESNL